MSSVVNTISRGKLIGNGADRKVILGYKPVHVQLQNITDRISYDKMELMDTDKALKRIATGVGTFVAAITLNSDGFTIIAAEYVADKEFHYVALEARND